MSASLVMFLAFIAITLGITAWASRRTGTTAEFYSAGRRITGFQNGWAVAGDYMSAASTPPISSPSRSSSWRGG